MIRDDKGGSRVTQNNRHRQRSDQSNTVVVDNDALLKGRRRKERLDSLIRRCILTMEARVLDGDVDQSLGALEMSQLWLETKVEE